MEAGALASLARKLEALDYAVPAEGLPALAGPVVEQARSAPGARRRRSGFASAWLLLRAASRWCFVCSDCGACCLAPFLCLQLLRDLVHTTDSHRSLKQRAAKQAHDLEAWRDKARPRRGSTAHAAKPSSKRAGALLARGSAG